MAEANYLSEGCSIDWTPTAAVTAGEVVQITDGRAAFAPTAIAAGVKGAVRVSGIADLAKTASMVIVKGSRLYWDASASKVHLLQVSSTDFFVGVAQEDAVAAATTVEVALNVDAAYKLSLGDGFSSLPISNAGWPHIVGHREGVSFIFDATAEAQKLDALSQRSVAVGTPGVVEALVSINVNGDDAAFDLNIGLANATHATDADTITESLFLHVDGASLNLNLESDDGSTEVASTDSTVDGVLLTPFLVQWDLRSWADPQVYINGVNVLPSSVFDISAATGPMKLLAHMEKSSNDSPGNVTVHSLGFRSFDV